MTSHCSAAVLEVQLTALWCVNYSGTHQAFLASGVNPGVTCQLTLTLMCIVGPPLRQSRKHISHRIVLSPFWCYAFGKLGVQLLFEETMTLKVQKL